MKQFLTLVLASILGGVIAVTGMYLLQTETITTQAKDISTVLARQQDVDVVTSTNTVDFKIAAAKSTPAVVQIYAAESIEQARARNQQRSRSLFEDFFGNDFFGFGQSRPRNGSGSGVIISSDGYIVTNNHVVGFADNIKVTLEDGKVYKAEKVGVEPITDLAVIKIEAEGLPSIPYGNSDNIAIGEWVLAVGNPFSYLTSTVTAGIVSAKGRDLDLIEGSGSIVEFIQTDAAVNPGNSGGALVNIRGELVGINTAIATPTGVYAGYSFAIPSNLVKTIVHTIIENGDIRGNTLGIEGYDVDQYLVEEFGLGVKSGFYVARLSKNGNAAQAGILEGDVIVSIDNQEVYVFEDLEKAMSLTTIGQRVDIIVHRNGKLKTLSTTLKKNN